jgi:hypothetical protein
MTKGIVDTGGVAVYIAGIYNRRLDGVNGNYMSSLPTGSVRRMKGGQNRH